MFDKEQWLDALEHARLESGRTRYEEAEWLAVTPSSYYQWARGTSLPNVPWFLHICDAYRWPPARFWRSRLQG